MSESNRRQVHDTLRGVRSRWIAAVSLRAVARALGGVAALVAAALGIDWLLAPADISVLLLAVVVGMAAVGFATWMLWPLRRVPTAGQVARFVEEQRPELEDRLTSATELVEQGDRTGFHDLVVADAATELQRTDIDSIVSRRAIARAALTAAGVVACLASVLWLAREPADRARRAAGLYLFPYTARIEVVPGDVKLVAGRPLAIKARLRSPFGAPARTVPVLRFGDGQTWQTADMRPAAEGFEFAFPAVNDPFKYQVSLASVSSPGYSVVVLRAPRVERIDLRYEYPAFIKLAPRLEEDGGDIYAPAGTTVRLRVLADKGVRSGAMVMGDGTRVELASVSERVLEGHLKLSEDGAYRVALADVDGLRNAGDTEYFIRLMDDRPPDVRIVRPGGDRDVTPLEEVVVEARADDDFGVERFELVYSVRGRGEQVLPLSRAAPAQAVTGARTLYLEDLSVQPGDFVTYYARARDVGRGKRATEARSDIFFLEVKPFEEEFVAAQSQAMAGGASGNRALDDLAAAQKEIIIATWKLDRRAAAGKSDDDIKAIAQAQGELKARAEQMTNLLRPTQRDARQRPRPGNAPAEPALDDPMAKAVQAMGRAQAELEATRTARALPHEMEALNELLKAQAEVRRRQVARQNAQGGGGGVQRAQADLSALFDRELRRQQQTQYETRSSIEDREEEKENDALNRVKELAARQDELNRRQRDLARRQAQMTPEELKRELERLTREQSELRQTAEELSRQLAQQQQQQQQQRGGQQPQGGQQSGQQQGAQPGQSARSGQSLGDARMREATEEMRSAASELRRQDLTRANDRGERAVERLRDMERELRGNQPDERRRALGEAQLEARQIADAQRRVAGETGRLDPKGQNSDALRRLAGEKDRIAARTEQLGRRVRELSSQSASEARRALDHAAQELDRQRIVPRMREGAADLRKRGEANAPLGRDPKQMAENEQQLAGALERMADRMGAAGAPGDEAGRRASEQLGRARDMRERIAEIERRIHVIDEAAKPGQPAAQGQPASSTNGNRGQQASANAANASGSDKGRDAQRGNGKGGRGGELAQLRAEYERALREAQDFLNQAVRDSPAAGRGRSTPEQHEFSLSAPGTEAFKQDFAKWDVLRRDVTLGLERLETSLSDKLRDRDTRDRLNAGGNERTPEEYRKLVEQYYQSIARKKR